jgi:hypothetical protein
MKLICFKYFLGFEILPVVIMIVAIIWNITQYITYENRRFGG